MNKKINAVFENGVFRPAEPIDLPAALQARDRRRLRIAREAFFEPSPDEIEAAWIAYENKEAD